MLENLFIVLICIGGTVSVLLFSYYYTEVLFPEIGEEIRKKELAKKCYQKAKKRIEDEKYELYLKQFKFYYKEEYNKECEKWLINKALFIAIKNVNLW